MGSALMDPFQANCDEAVSSMEQCIISLYDVDINDHKQCDPDDLYWLVD